MSYPDPYRKTVVYDPPAPTEGSPERPGRPRHVWEIESVTPVGKANDEDHELFYLVQRVVGAWVKTADDDYTVEYEPRDEDLPPIQRLQLSYLDADGSIQNELRKNEAHR